MRWREKERGIKKRWWKRRGRGKELGERDGKKKWWKSRGKEKGHGKKKEGMPKRCVGAKIKVHLKVWGPPSVHGYVAFWSFNGGSSYHTVAAKGIAQCRPSSIWMRVYWFVVRLINACLLLGFRPRIQPRVRKVLLRSNSPLTVKLFQVRQRS